MGGEKLVEEIVELRKKLRAEIALREAYQRRALVAEKELAEIKLLCALPSGCPGDLDSDQ